MHRLKILGHRPRNPPSTTSTDPVTNWLAALDRNSVTPAKSAGWPHRPAGQRATRAAYCSGSERRSVFLFNHTVRPMVYYSNGRLTIERCTHMSVAMEPGAIAFTWILYRAHSLLKDLVNCDTAPLDAAYEATISPPMKLFKDDTLTILPDRRGIICRPAP